MHWEQPSAHGKQDAVPVLISGDPRGCFSYVEEAAGEKIQCWPQQCRQADLLPQAWLNHLLVCLGHETPVVCGLAGLEVNWPELEFHCPDPGVDWEPLP